MRLLIVAKVSKNPLFCAKIPALEMKKIMAIVNLTPDSFYPGSRVYAEDGTFDAAAFLFQVRSALKNGAHIIDLGACSTRPGHQLLSPDIEIERLRPALELWREHFSDVVLSIDTYYSKVVEFATDYSSRLMINDVSAGDFDADMLPLAARLSCPYVAMHHAPLHEAEDGVEAVTRWYYDFAEKAENMGVREWIFDPGFGFGKSLEQNWALLRHLDKLPHERPILVGVSRKSMLYRLLPQALDPSCSSAQLSSLEDTQLLTSFAHRLALSGGASIFRVHSTEKVF